MRDRYAQLRAIPEPTFPAGGGTRKSVGCRSTTRGLHTIRFGFLGSCCTRRPDCNASTHGTAATGAPRAFPRPPPTEPSTQGSAACFSQMPIRQSRCPRGTTFAACPLACHARVGRCLPTATVGPVPLCWPLIRPPPERVCQRGDQHAPLFSWLWPPAPLTTPAHTSAHPRGATARPPRHASGVFPSACPSTRDRRRSPPKQHHHPLLSTTAYLGGVPLPRLSTFPLFFVSFADSSWGEGGDDDGSTPRPRRDRPATAAAPATGGTRPPALAAARRAIRGAGGGATQTPRPASNAAASARAFPPPRGGLWRWAIQLDLPPARPPPRLVCRRRAAVGRRRHMGPPLRGGGGRRRRECGAGAPLLLHCRLARTRTPGRRASLLWLSPPPPLARSSPTSVVPFSTSTMPCWAGHPTRGLVRPPRHPPRRPSRPIP